MAYFIIQSGTIVSMSGDMTLIPETQWFPKESGHSSLGTLLLPFSGIYADNLYLKGVPFNGITVSGLNIGSGIGMFSEMSGTNLLFKSISGNNIISLFDNGQTINISIFSGSSTTDGYISSGDWVNFNSKQASGNYLMSGITTSYVPEGSNLYYTPARVSGIIATQAGIPLGLATLDSSGLVPESQLPLITITDTFVVNSSGAMVALIAQVGDVAVRTDLSKSFILRLSGASVYSNWQELLTPGQVTISGTSPITVTNGLIEILSGSSIQNGYISSGDWVNFNSKQSSGTSLLLDQTTVQTVYSGAPIFQNGIKSAIISGISYPTKIDMSAPPLPGVYIDLVPLMTSLTTPAGVITASALSNWGSPVNVFNHDTTTVSNFWQPNQGGAVWIQYQFTAPTLVNVYQITAGGNASDPASWHLQGSTDGTNFTTLDTKTSQTFNNTLSTKTVQFSNTVAYTYYRFWVDSHYGPLMVLNELLLAVELTVSPDLTIYTNATERMRFLDQGTINVLTPLNMMASQNITLETSGSSSIGTASLPLSNLYSNNLFRSGVAIFPATATSPISVNNGLISIPSGSSLANGYISSGDWVNFNSKQSSGNYIVSGSSTILNNLNVSTLSGTTISGSSIFQNGIQVVNSGIGAGNVTVTRTNGTLTISGTQYILPTNVVDTVSNSGLGISLYNSQNNSIIYLNSISGLGTISISPQLNGVINISGSSTGLPSNVVQSASNSGVGFNIYNSQAGNNLIFNTISGNGNITVSSTNGTINISGTQYILPSNVDFTIINSSIISGTTISGNSLWLSGTQFIPSNYQPIGSYIISGTSTSLNVLNATVLSGTTISGGSIFVNGIQIIPTNYQPTGNYVVSGSSTILNVLDATVLSGTTISGDSIFVNGSQVLTTLSSSGLGVSLFNSKTSSTAFLNTISGAGNVSIATQSNGVVIISGNGGVGGGVTDLNSLTGSVLISGVGNTSVTTAGSVITISGIASTANVSGTSPIIVNSGLVSILSGSSVQNGYISSGDWVNFNSKASGNFVHIVGDTMSGNLGISAISPEYRLTDGNYSRLIRTSGTSEIDLRNQVNVLASDSIGGVITHSGSYTIHTFSGVGTYTFIPVGTQIVEVLVVAGGGGGGVLGGGGGGGGVVYHASKSVTGNQTVIVGAGGAGAPPPTPWLRGSNGGDSQFSDIIAKGGSGGNSQTLSDSLAGGSTGGVMGGTPSAVVQTNSGGGTGYGNIGGFGIAAGASSGGGGGGAGTSGVSSVGFVGGNGGSGVSFIGVTVGGGGGGGSQGGTGGTGKGGGGNGSGGNTATVGTDGTGGGGGSSGYAGGYGLAKKGGDGIVIVRYVPSASLFEHTVLLSKNSLIAGEAGTAIFGPDSASTHLNGGNIYFDINSINKGTIDSIGNISLSGNATAVDIFGSHISAFKNISGVNYTVLTTDRYITVDTTGGNRVITLPTAVGNTGRIFDIRKITSDSYLAIVSGTSSQTINNVITKEIQYQNSNMEVISNGTNWGII